MKAQTAATVEWQEVGGTLTIPDGWFVTGVNCDLPEPSIQITNGTGDEDKKLPVPKALAYFLSVHHCGSMAMRENIEQAARRNVQNEIKRALAI